MNDSESHGASGSPPSNIAQPSLAERARTLMELGGASSLATMSQKQPGYPFASVMPYGLDSTGNPTFLISQMAMHTQNLTAVPRATLLVAERFGSPLGSARISLIGDVGRVDESQKQEIAATYLKRHPKAQQWAKFGDFSFYRLQIKAIYFVGGFGIMGWITPDDYAAAEADPLTHVASEIVSHMNQDHVDSMVLLAKHHMQLDASDAKMTNVDRYGFTMMLKIAEEIRGGRISFPQKADSANDVRLRMVEMVKAARTQA